MHPVDGVIYLLLWLAAALLLVLWVLLPFAVFGMKPLLRRAVDEQVRTRQAIEQLLEEVRKQGAAPK